MPDQKISQLASGTNAQVGDLFVIARSGANYSLTTAQLFNAPSATATLAALTVDTNTLFVDAANNRVGIGTTSPQSALHVEGLGNTVAARIFTSDNVASATADLLFGTTPGARTKAAIRMVNTNTGNSEGSLSLWTNNGTSLLERWSISGSGHLLPGADNAYDIGGSGTPRVRHIYVGSGITTSNAYLGTLYLNGTTKRYLQYMSTNDLRWVRETSGGVFEATSMVLDVNGNLGINVTPSAWLTYRAIQLAGGSLAGFGTTFIELFQNSFWDGAYKYVNSSAASRYEQTAGRHAWYTAPSGTAGNAITFTQAMTLDASGNLGLSIVPNVWDASTAAIQVRNTYIWNPGSATQSYFGTNGYYDTSWKYRSTGAAATYHQVGAEHRWLSAASGTAGTAISFTQAMTLDASGYLGIGNTVMATMNAANGAGNLVVGTGSGFEGITVYSGTTNYGVLYFADSTTGTSTYAGGVEYNHSTDSLGFVVNTATRWRIDSSGHLLANADNVYDIGTSATRPRNVYVGTELVSNKVTAGTTGSSYTLNVLRASGANRDLLQAGISGTSNGLTVKWDHATTKTHINIADIPTSSAGLPAGTLWSDSGTIKIA